MSSIEMSLDEYAIITSGLTREKQHCRWMLEDQRFLKDETIEFFTQRLALVQRAEQTLQLLYLATAREETRLC